MAGAPRGAEWHDVSADGHAYWRLLADAWQHSIATGRDLLIIEHDVICHHDVVPQLELCPEPWCVFGYTPICHEACLEAWANMLGCTRFRAELIAECPKALASIPEERRDWHNLCDEIAGNKIGGVDQPTLREHSVRAAGYTHHWHTPRVRHHTWENR